MTLIYLSNCPHCLYDNGTVEIMMIKSTSNQTGLACNNCGTLFISDPDQPTPEFFRKQTPKVEVEGGQS